MERLTLQPGEHCPECRGELSKGSQIRTCGLQGQTVSVETDGLWCQCGEGIVDLRDLDQISVDGPADALRDGLLDSGATPQDMLADLRQRREADDTP